MKLSGAPLLVTLEDVVTALEVGTDAAGEELEARKSAKSNIKEGKVTYEGLAAAPTGEGEGEELEDGAALAFAGEGAEAACPAGEAAGEEAADEEDAADAAEDPEEPEDDEPEPDETGAGVPPTVASWKRLGWAPSGKSYRRL